MLWQRLLTLLIAAKIQLGGVIANVLLQPPLATAFSLFPEASFGIMQITGDKVRAGGALHISFPWARKLLFAE